MRDSVNQFSRFGKTKDADRKQFAPHLRYQQGDFKKASIYAALDSQCAKREKQWGAKAQRFFYMATPPSMFGEFPKYLGRARQLLDHLIVGDVKSDPQGRGYFSFKETDDL